MDLDFIFFPGCMNDPKKLKDEQIIWIPKLKQYQSFDYLSQYDDVQDENIDSLDKNISQLHRMRKNIGKASKDLEFEKDSINPPNSRKILGGYMISQSQQQEKLLNQAQVSSPQKFTNHENIDDSLYLLDASQNLEGKINRINNSNNQILFISKNLNIQVKEEEGQLKKDEKVDYYIPCLFLNSKNGSQQLVLYFHGNGEDISQSYELLNSMRNNLQINIIAMEYPTYGIYKASSCKLDNILEDSIYVYDYVISKMNISDDQIVLVGRSIGSGIASHIASLRNPAALVLISAFASLRSVVRDIAGKIFQYLIKEKLDNLKAIENTRCPLFLLHGQKDRLIPYQHSQQLKEKCKQYSELIIPKEMNHVQLDFFFDLILPLKKFLTRIKFIYEKERNALYQSYSSNQKQPLITRKTPQPPKPLLIQKPLMTCCYNPRKIVQLQQNPKQKISQKPQNILIMGDNDFINDKQLQSEVILTQQSTQ